VTVARHASTSNEFRSYTQDEGDFIPSKKFTGVKDGYFYAMGERGADYYRRDGYEGLREDKME
jgi:hypothetical protein